jgi:hypothetical protein
LLTLLAAGCGSVTPRSAPSPTSTAYGPNVVHSEGIGQNTRIGDTRSTLRPRLADSRGNCAEQLRDVPQANLVFDGSDKLALIWFESPLRTPEGVGNGSTLAEVRQAYPTLSELTPPAGSHQFAGLLVADGEQGYLFLHDGGVVVKSIAGQSAQLQQLFSGGFGAC